MGIDGIFGRSDIAAITKDSVTAAGNLITNADLIEPVSGFGKGKYKFMYSPSPIFGRIMMGAIVVHEFLRRDLSRLFSLIKRVFRMKTSCLMSRKQLFPRKTSCLKHSF